MDRIRIGTRKSQLALWQAHFVGGLLQAKGIATEIIEMETRGDKNLDVSISKIGSKGVFTAELEEKLRSGDIDIAVHSAKDIQSHLKADLEIIAFSKRTSPHDVIISSNPNLNLVDGNPIIGTSSTRRTALFRNSYPHFSVADMRGNLQTRIMKMRDGNCDALALAYAGVHRMGYEHLIIEHLDPDKFIPAVAQGSIAVETCTKLSSGKRDLIRSIVNHDETEICIKTERAYLKKLEGGCSIPVFGLATLQHNTIELNAGIASLDGTKKYQLRKIGGVESPEQLGSLAGGLLLQSEGGDILEEIKARL